jgi:hypothetical protein
VKKLELEEKRRLRKLLVKAGVVLGVGFGYMLFVKLVGWGIPCVFYLLTGLDCPGCGISRMFLALAAGDILLAARNNLLVLCLLPFGLVLAGYKAWQYVRTGQTPMGNGERIFYVVAFVLCIAFFVLRNTDWIPFLYLD